MLIAASLPPFGWWPLAILGAAVVIVSLQGQPARWRLACGLAAGVGLYVPSLWWVIDFSAPGYVVLVLLESLLLAAAVVLVPGRPTVSRTLAFPGALVLAEAVRGHFPLGGLPLAGIDLGQADSPLAPAARLGGHLLLVALVALAGVAVALVADLAIGYRRARRSRAANAGAPSVQAEPERSRRKPTLVAAAVVAVLVVGVTVLGATAAPGRAGRPLIVAAVQGGGPRGLRAIDVDPHAVFEAQLAETAKLRPPVDLVVWPENVINIDGSLDGSPEDAAVGDLARRLHATIVAGVVEDLPGAARRFRNAAVAWAPDGARVARYDKVHRVPFGEYIPARSLVSRLADVSAVPRDAIVGHGPGVLVTPAGPLGVVISYEVFFSDRARAAIQAGGQILLVPTNASSYRTSQVPSQELAAARLRALETGRAVVQAAPTGFSAVVNADGSVAMTSGLGHPATVEWPVRLRTGETPATRLGETPIVFVALMLLVAGWTSSKLRSVSGGRRRFGSSAGT